MDHETTGIEESDLLSTDDFPDGLTTGATVLVATPGQTATAAVGLQTLCQVGHAEDVAVVVTTTDSADRTVERYEMLCRDREGPALKLVDTTADQQVSAMYDKTPVVRIPSPGDLERLVVAVSELVEGSSPTNGDRHLLVQSLTPILEEAPIDRVCTILERMTGLRSESGLCLLEIDYTAHDEETMSALADRVDGVLWVSRSESDGISLDYQPSRNRTGASVRHFEHTSH
jgi:KaiC/GvpD/RAD55 family RecA-like ATPase